VERRDLNAFDVAESKLFWAARGLDPEDPSLGALTNRLEGYPLALLVTSGAMAQSLAPSLSAFFSTNADFDPLRDGITHDTARDDVFRRALTDLALNEREVLRTIAFLPLPPEESFLRTLMSQLRKQAPERDSKTRSHDGAALLATLQSLRERALIAIGRRGIEMHPVVRGVVKARERGEQEFVINQQLVQALRGIPRPRQVESLRDLDYDVNLSACLVACGAFEEASHLIATKGVRPILQELARLGEERTKTMVLAQFFEIDHSADPIGIRFKADNDQAFRQRREAKSDFAMSLGRSYADTGDHALALALFGTHRSCGLCRDPLCATTDRPSLEAEGRFASSARVLKNSIEEARRSKNLSPHMQSRLEGALAEWALATKDASAARIALARELAVLREHGELASSFNNTESLQSEIRNLNLDRARVGLIENSHDEAARIVESVLIDASVGHDVPTQRVALGLLGRIELSRGQPYEAETALRRSLALELDASTRYRSVQTLCTLAEALSAQGDQDKACDVVRNALAIAKPAGDVLRRAQATLVLARIAHAEGDLIKERTALLEVIQTFTHEAGIPRGWYELETALELLGNTADQELFRRGWSFADRMSFSTRLLNPRDRYHARASDVGFALEPVWFDA
jgi:tetratricopeptide (TPR) repeat protein